jgi:hypothetical protein
MTTSGNDPFSGTNTRDLLQHIISPKVVSDGSSGYAVKTDLINVDGIYAKGIIRAGTGGSGDVQTTSAFAVVDPTYTTTYARITGDSTAAYLQSPSVIRFGKITTSSVNTSINLGTGGLNNDTMTVGGTITIAGGYNTTTPTTISMSSSYNSGETTETQNAPVTRYVKRGTTPGSATSFQIFNIDQFITFGMVFHWVYRDADGNIAWGFVSKIGGNAVATLQVGGNDMSGTATSGGVTISIDTVNQPDGIKITTSNTNKAYSVTVMQMSVT